MPKITKKQLRQIIKEEKAQLLNERAGHAVGLGFAGWEPTRNPDFAKAYGAEARTIGHSHPTPGSQLSEQPISGRQADQMAGEQALRDAYKALQEILFDADKAMNAWVDRHHDVLDTAGELDDPNSLTIRMDDLRLDMKDLADEAYKRR